MGERVLLPNPFHLSVEVEGSFCVCFRDEESAAEVLHQDRGHQFSVCLSLKPLRKKQEEKTQILHCPEY